MLGPDGYVVPEIEYQVAQTVKKDKTPFLTDEEEEEEKRKQLDSQANNVNGSEVLNKYPPELKCPFGDHIIKDAVLIPCCGHFICCDECIKKKISNDEFVECHHKDCDQEIGSLESITPYHDIRKRVIEYLNDLKFSNHRSTVNTAVNSVNLSQSTKSDAFFELLLNDVKDENTNESSDDMYVSKSFNQKSELLIEECNKINRLHSPLQDSKISSSDLTAASAAAAALAKQNVSNETTNTDALTLAKQDVLRDTNQQQQNINQLPPHQQPALLPTPPLTIESKNMQPINMLNTVPTALNPNMRHQASIQNDISNIHIQPGRTNSFMLNQQNM